VSSIDDASPDFISSSLNWPGKQGTPVHSFKPDIYKPLNFPALIGFTPLYEVQKSNEKSLHDLLMNIPQDGHPLLIYYHCVAGKDRTGAVSMAYFMTYGGYPFIAHDAIKKIGKTRSQPLSFDEALTATTIPGHAANEYSVKLSKAYCLFLGRNRNDCQLEA
jgi:hypothetical protein